MLGTREYTLCLPFRANAHNSSSLIVNNYTIIPPLWELQNLTF